MMRKLFIPLMLGLSVSGCLTVHTPTGTQRFILPQVSVVVRVVNNCAPLLDIWGPTGLLVEGLGYGGVATVPLVSQAFTGNYRYVEAMVQGYNLNKVYLGSESKGFYVDTQQGSRQENWTIEYLRLLSGRGGCV
jgi:hypothetical protein